MPDQDLIEGRRQFDDAAHALARRLQADGISSVLAAVSGGADSMLTLHLLAAAARYLDHFRLGICHVNFRLRGEESHRDQRLVELIADHISRQLAPTPARVELHIQAYDTQAYAARQAISIEMAARELRHNLWDSLIKSHGYQRIATGHNADDNEETLLLNLLRGSSPHGLRAMAPNGNRIIRPLLYMPRTEILRMLSQTQLPTDIAREYPKGYVTDSTNLTSDYRRNFLRNEIIPLLQQRWEGIHTALQTTIRIQAESADIIDFAIDNALADESDPDSLRWSTIARFPAPASLIYHWLRRHADSHAPLNAPLSTIAREAASHIPQSPEQPCLTTGRHWQITTDSELLTTPYSLQIRPTDTVITAATKFECRWQPLTLDDTLYNRIRHATPDEAYLPLGADCYEWRTPRTADRMRILSRRQQGSKLVSDILKEAGIPAAQRREIRMLVNRESGQIIWIPGIRRAGADLIPTPDAAPDAGSATIYRLTIRQSDDKS